MRDEMRTIEVKTADRHTIPIQFHREAYRCWHVLMPAHLDTFQLPYAERVEEGASDKSLSPAAIASTSRDYTYRGPKGELVLATSSLERAMSVIADYITRTEF